MRQVVIENPILNAPFVEPVRHFRFTDDGITDEIIEARRISSYFIPIARPRSRGKQDQLQAAFEDWTADRIEENKLVNRIRERVQLWRRGHYAGVSTTTRLLLDYWNNPEREKKLFFCQIEALETLIYVTEVAGRYGDAWIENELRAASGRSSSTTTSKTGPTALSSAIRCW